MYSTCRHLQIRDLAIPEALELLVQLGCHVRPLIGVCVGLLPGVSQLLRLLHA